MLEALGHAVVWHLLWWWTGDWVAEASFISIACNRSSIKSLDAKPWLNLFCWQHFTCPYMGCPLEGDTWHPSLGSFGLHLMYLFPLLGREFQLTLTEWSDFQHGFEIMFCLVNTYFAILSIETETPNIRKVLAHWLFCARKAHFIVQC